MKILITGGTGFIGRHLAELNEDVTIFSRNESQQVSMKLVHPEYSYIIGDVCDYASVLSACEGMDYVFHFAALKHVNICEQQPMEAVRINMVGTAHVINACLYHKVKLINMSSDKAINPDNVYGKTKSLAEDMVTRAGFLSIRSSNVLWSTGSVLPIWKEQVEATGTISLTSDKMTRFFIHVEELVKFILENKDEVGIKTVTMKSFRMIDIAKRFNPTSIKIIGLRDGERLHEFRDENTSSEDCISDDLNYIYNG